MTERDAQFFDQVGGLLERHVAIRVAMDQQQRGGRQFAMLATGDAPDSPNAGEGD